MIGENIKLKITSYFDHSSGEIVDELMARSPDATEEPSTKYMLSDIHFSVCLATIMSYSYLLSQMHLSAPFDFPEDGVYKRDVLNIVSAYLDETPEWRAQSLDSVMLAALTDFYNPRN